MIVEIIINLIHMQKKNHYLLSMVVSISLNQVVLIIFGTTSHLILNINSCTITKNDVHFKYYGEQNYVFYKLDEHKIQINYLPAEHCKIHK